MSLFSISDQCRKSFPINKTRPKTAFTTLKICDLIEHVIAQLVTGNVMYMYKTRSWTFVKIQNDKKVCTFCTFLSCNAKSSIMPHNAIDSISARKIAGSKNIQTSMTMPIVATLILVRRVL